MPAATRYWSDNPQDSADRDLRETAEAERRARAEAYRDACNQYDGRHRKFLKARDTNTDPNVVINLDGEAIDYIINFATPDMFTLQLDEDSKLSDTETQIIDIFEDNGGAALVQDMMLYGCLSGHVYVRLYGAQFTPSNDGTYSLDPDADMRIVALNPATMITFWSAEDKDTVLWHEQQYTADRKYKVDYVNLWAQGGQGWLIRKYRMTNNSWEFISEEAWPLEHGPIIDWQHLRDPRYYYGRGHLSASRINDSVNKVASDIKQILRYHAQPRTIGKGVNPADITATSIDGMMSIPGDTADVKRDVFNLEMQSDLASSMNFFMTLREAHANGMNITLLQGGADAYKGVTNLGLKVAFMKMLAQNERLHRSYSNGLKRIIEVILELMGMDTEMVKPKLTWPMALPMSELEATQTVQMQMDMGVLSKESAATELGIDWQQEQERLDSEGADAQAMADMVGQLVGQQQAQAQQTPPNGNGAAVSNREMAR